MSEPARRLSANFITAIIEEDLRRAAGTGKVCTRFPPEPNGYLHVGHAKAICLNFGIARDYPGGRCRLRFDDTNPETESSEYAEAIEEDIRWLGFDWDGPACHASDYFDRLYEYAQELIRRGKAYVDSQGSDDIRAQRGTLTEPGRDSPYRNRGVRENLELFRRMRVGKFEEGECVLRARIDMASPNLNMRDPVIYRVRKHPHYRTGNRWCVYPMYDYTQCMSDALEGVTHSLCTLEFEDHRPLYDWFLAQLPVPHLPRQIEFARLNLTYTVTSKRLLAQMVSSGCVDGWDDPRMPTLRGMRRRGYTPEAIRDFCDRIGLTKKDATIDVGLLENCLREDLNRTCPRAMAVLRPLRLTIENYPADHEERFEIPNHPNDPSHGVRSVPFCREVLIEREDFMEEPPPGYRRLAPGSEVRLRYAYLVTCRELRRDPQSGEIVELLCRYDPASRGGSAPDGRKVKGTLHWVSARHGIRAPIRLYDRLFRVPDPAALGEDWLSGFNLASLETLHAARLEPSLVSAVVGRYQFERLGYFCADERDSRPGQPVFNRILALRDPWADGRKQVIKPG